MLDIKRIRQNPEALVEAMRKRRIERKLNALFVD